MVRSFASLVIAHVADLKFHQWMRRETSWNLLRKSSSTLHQLHRLVYEITPPARGKSQATRRRLPSNSSTTRARELTIRRIVVLTLIRSTSQLG